MQIRVISIPYDSGNFKQRMGAGPGRLIPHITEHLRKSGNIVHLDEILDSSSFQTETTTSFCLSRMAASSVLTALNNGEFPIIISGNCNTAAMAATCGLGNKPGVIWMDCHADFNTPETTIGGFLDGMAVSILAGHCWKQLSASIPGYEPIPEEKIVLVGVRDIDPLEAERIDHSSLTIIPAEKIKRDSIIQLPPIDGPVYLHIDLDVIDPDIVKVNNYNTTGGLTDNLLLKVIKTIKRTYAISAVSFTAYDPTLDPEEKMPGIVTLLLTGIIENN